VQDFPKAADYYKTGAQAGNVEAQWCLGRMCQLGQGLEQPDEAQALVWFTMAAEQNLAVAQYEVGRSLVPLFPCSPVPFPLFVPLSRPAAASLPLSSNIFPRRLGSREKPPTTTRVQQRCFDQRLMPPVTTLKHSSALGGCTNSELASKKTFFSPGFTLTLLPWGVTVVRASL